MLLPPLKEETLKDLTEQKPSRGIDFCSSASNRDGNIKKPYIVNQFKVAQNSLKEKRHSFKTEGSPWSPSLVVLVVKQSRQKMFKPPSLVVLVQVVQVQATISGCHSMLVDTPKLLCHCQPTHMTRATRAFPNRNGLYISAWLYAEHLCLYISASICVLWWPSVTHALFLPPHWISASYSFLQTSVHKCQQPQTSLYCDKIGN